MIDYKKVLEYYEKELTKVEQRLNDIFMEIKDADIKGGIDESCRVQNKFGKEIELLLIRRGYYRDNIKILKDSQYLFNNN